MSKECMRVFDRMIPLAVTLPQTCSPLDFGNFQNEYLQHDVLQDILCVFHYFISINLPNQKCVGNESIYFN